MGKIRDYQVTAHSTLLRQGLASLQLTPRAVAGAAPSTSAVISHGLSLGRAPQLPTRAFIGRGTELEQLRSLLVPKLIRNVVAIVGAGGLGKTQLAITFAQRSHDQYSSLFWFDAKDESSLKQDLFKLANVVLDDGESITANISDEEDSIRRVQNFFSRPESGQWLLIFGKHPRFLELGVCLGHFPLLSLWCLILSEI
jgi:hypothetical protein